MIYDCFAFFNELDLLEIRLNILNDVVDKFVLVESGRTFQKKPKPYYFDENKARFQPFLHKIIHIKLDEYPGFFYKFRVPNSWDYDNYQKDQVKRALLHCQPNDTIIYSDLDEIPNPQAILEHKDKPGYKAFQMRHYYYFLNYLEVVPGTDQPAWWYGSVMCAYKDLKTIKKLRMQRDVAKYKDSIVCPDAGWHFAYLGGVEKIIQKIEAYTHTEHNKEAYKNPDRIRELIMQGKGLYDNELECRKQAFDHTYPPYLRHHYTQYPELYI